MDLEKEEGWGQHRLIVPSTWIHRRMPGSPICHSSLRQEDPARSGSAAFWDHVTSWELRVMQQHPWPPPSLEGTVTHRGPKETAQLWGTLRGPGLTNSTKPARASALLKGITAWVHSPTEARALSRTRRCLSALFCGSQASPEGHFQERGLGTRPWPGSSTVPKACHIAGAYEHPQCPTHLPSSRNVRL